MAGFQLAGGGVIENLIISNVVVKGIRCPIWMSARGMYARKNPDDAIRNVHISNLTATGVGKPSVASLIQGSKETPIENLLLSDITILSVSTRTKDMINNPVPEDVGDPNELSNCSGLYLRYIKDLEMHNVRFGKLENDERPVLICDNIDRLQMDNVRCLNDTDPQAFLLRDIKTLKRNNTETVD